MQLKYKLIRIEQYDELNNETYSLTFAPIDAVETKSAWKNIASGEFRISGLDKSAASQFIYGNQYTLEIV